MWGLKVVADDFSWQKPFPLSYWNQKIPKGVVTGVSIICKPSLYVSQVFVKVGPKVTKTATKVSAL